MTTGHTLPSVLSNQPGMSVIVCTKDRPDSLRPTLDSLSRQRYDNFEVLVVDQSRGSDTRQVVESLMPGFPSLRYLQLERTGLSRAYNAGIRQTEGALVAFTDDDCIASEGWLDEIALAFRQHSEVGFLYGQVLLPPELSAQENVSGVTPALAIPERRILSRRDGFTVFGMGANFAARREALIKVGDFDEVLGGGGPLQSAQDFDFVYRIFKSGLCTLLEPDVIVYHYGFRSHSQWPATIRSYGIGVGGFYFKHVRMGDAYAALLLLRHLLWEGARLTKYVLTFRGAGLQWIYVKNILAGMRKSMRFGIDSGRRLYQPTEPDINTTHLGLEAK